MARKQDMDSTQAEALDLIDKAMGHVEALAQEVQENRAKTALALQIVRDYERVLDVLEKISDTGTDVSDLRKIGLLIRMARKNGDEFMARHEAENEAARHHKGGTA